MKSEVGGEKSGGEKEVAHELRFDSEAVGMREAEHGGDTAVAHQSSRLREVDEVKNRLKPTPGRNEETADEKDTPKSVNKIFRQLNKFA